MAEATHGYLAFDECGCCFGATVDNPDHPKRTIDGLKEFIDDGAARIERVPIEECRRRVGEKCEKHREVPNGG